MSKGLAILHIARVTIEAKGPLSIAGERVDPEVDVAVERDANGLPAIPGTSIAGSLRHLREAEFRGDDGEAKYDRLFGWTAADIREIEEDELPRADTTYQASRLAVTWAHVHDATDSAVDGLVTDRQKLRDDPILAPLLDPVPARRDHVALDHRGVAGDEVKFDRSYVPPGYRFTFELRLRSDKQRADAEKRADADWNEVLDLLGSPFWRLGGATLRGYGRVAVIRLATGRFDLGDADDYRRFMRHKPGLERPSEALDVCQPPEPGGGIGGVIRLVPEDFIRFGQGEALLGEHPDRDQEHSVDMLLLTVPKVRWPAEGVASLESQAHLLVPASAVKGAIAHRLRFHLHCRHKVFVDQPDGLEQRQAAAAADHEAIFGSAKKDKDGSPTGKAGRLYLDDQLLPLADHREQIELAAHNSIDRFSGGVRKSALFSEELLFRPKLEIPFRLDPPTDLEPEALARLQACFRQTLADLVEGRLALGAGGSKGHGYCRGEVLPSSADAGAWLPEKSG